MSDAGADLAVIIPMYRESRRIGLTLSDIEATAGSMPYTMRLVLVDDGSDDDTAGAVREAVARINAGDTPARGRLVGATLVRHERNRGKGAAVRTGFAAAAAPWRLMMDADNSSRLLEAKRLIDAARYTGADLVMGSRVAPGSWVEAKPSRRVTGVIFRMVLRAHGLNLALDTQCGFKLYSGRLADAIVRHGIEDGFAFDIEHILIARRAGLATAEVGIQWTHRDGGKVSPLRDGARMARAIGPIRRRLTDAAITVLEPERELPEVHVLARLPSFDAAGRIGR